MHVAWMGAARALNKGLRIFYFVRVFLAFFFFLGGELVIISIPLRV